MCLSKKMNVQMVSWLRGYIMGWSIVVYLRMQGNSYLKKEYKFNMLGCFTKLQQVVCRLLLAEHMGSIDHLSRQKYILAR